MTDLTESMHRLIEPWTLVIEHDGHYRGQEFPPLLDMLRTVLTPGLESTTGSTPAAMRNPLDVKALDLLIHLEDIVRAWNAQWGIKAAGGIKHELVAWWDRLDALYRTGTIGQGEYARLRGYPDEWARRIWELVEPPLEVPLRGTRCPVCGEAKIHTDQGDLADNLLVSYREGETVIAECRRPECGAFWTGPESLAALGIRIGATLDRDVLQEMGVHV